MIWWPTPASDHALANRLEVVDGVLTGRIVGPIVTRDLKRQSLVT